MLTELLTGHQPFIGAVLGLGTRIEPGNDAEFDKAQGRLA